MGQITYSLNAQRFTAPARSEDNQPIKSGTRVKISRTVGNVFYVQRI
jgi:hypothetical protein